MHTTTGQLNNLKRLREVGRNIPPDQIEFGKWECGTHACLSGWYGRVTGRSADFAHLEGREHFGISAVDVIELFDAAYGPADQPGPAAYAELQNRLAYLDELIAEREPKLPIKYEGVPQSVLDIFKTKVAA